jgi:hypothetical protein
VRFVGFIADGPNDDLPAASNFTTLFPECPVESSKLLPPLPRFNECFARGIVKQMNQALGDQPSSARAKITRSAFISARIARRSRSPASNISAQRYDGAVCHCC